MNRALPSPTERLVLRKSGVLQPSSIAKFGGPVGKTAPRKCRDAVDHYPKLGFCRNHLAGLNQSQTLKVPNRAGRAKLGYADKLPVVLSARREHKLLNWLLETLRL
jgi:hypothetical protein